MAVLIGCCRGMVSHDATVASPATSSRLSIRGRRSSGLPSSPTRTQSERNKPWPVAYEFLGYCIQFFFLSTEVGEDNWECVTMAGYEVLGPWRTCLSRKPHLRPVRRALSRWRRGTSSLGRLASRHEEDFLPRPSISRLNHSAWYLAVSSIFSELSRCGGSPGRARN